MTATPDLTTLGSELGLTLGTPGRDGGVDLTLTHQGADVGAAHLDADEPCHRFTFELGGVIQVDMNLCADTSTGALTGTGTVQIWDPIDQEWVTALDLDGQTLLWFGPGSGSVGGDTATHPPVVDSPQYGKSKASSGATVTRFFVDDTEREIADVGRLVKAAFFETYPDFVFNVVACVGEPTGGVGLYGYPPSIWFNVFFGYYQIDVLKSAWNRPFGYEADAGPGSAVAFEDVARLGKSDWNYFSNWMYGVPVDAITPYNGVDMGSIVQQETPGVQVGKTYWDDVYIGNIEVVSAFQSSAPGAELLTFNTILTPFWQDSFGMPFPQEVPAQSFPPTTLEGRFYMSYFEDDDAYHTLMFGGTGAYKGDPGFIEAQRAAVRTVMATSYPTLGFAAG